MSSAVYACIIYLYPLEQRRAHEELIFQPFLRHLSRLVASRVTHDSITYIVTIRIRRSIMCGRQAINN